MTPERIMREIADLLPQVADDGNRWKMVTVSSEGGDHHGVCLMPLGIDVRAYLAEYGLEVKVRREEAFAYSSAAAETHEAAVLPTRH